MGRQRVLDAIASFLQSFSRILLLTTLTFATLLAWPNATCTFLPGTAADPTSMHIEWKVGNCEVGSDTAFSVALLDGSPIGSCWSPHCFTDVPAPPLDSAGPAEIEIVLLKMTAGRWARTEFGRRVALIWGPGTVRNTHRQQTCLPEPAASAEGELYVSDVVYSLVHRQLIIFGPTRKPLGGLYCEWDGNPQTSKTARKVCHPNRVAEELQRAWIWSRPPDGSWVGLPLGDTRLCRCRISRCHMPYLLPRNSSRPCATHLPACDTPSLACSALAPSRTSRPARRSSAPQPCPPCLPTPLSPSPALTLSLSACL